jgi:hypothetical protein
MLQKWVRRIFLGGNGRPVRKADNLTAICEPIIYKIWEPRRLTTLRASTAWCKDSFACYLLLEMLQTDISVVSNE